MKKIIFLQKIFFRQKKNYASKKFFFKKFFYSPTTFCRKLFFDVRTLKKTVCSEKKFFKFFQKIFFKKFFSKNFFSKNFFQKIFFQKNFFSKNFFSKNFFQKIFFQKIFFQKKFFCKKFFFEKFSNFFFSRFSRCWFFTRFIAIFIPPFFAKKIIKKWSFFDQFLGPHFFGFREPQKMAQKWPQNAIFLGNPLFRGFADVFGPKNGQKMTIFWSKNRGFPDFLGQGGMRKRKNGKNRWGKIKEKFRFLHFFAKNDDFFDFGAIFWPFFGPPKKGSKNGQKMTPKFGVIFCRFCDDFFFWLF